MFDENEHTHPQNNDEGPRHIHRGIKRSEPDEVEVDSADFFSPEPPRPSRPASAPQPEAGLPPEPPKSPVPPHKQWEPLHPSEAAPSADKLPKGGMVLLGLQAVLSLAALVQLWRTQMLPVLYLVIITALLVLLWLLVRKCLASRTGAVVARVLSVMLCAALAVGCVWAQQGLTTLNNVTSGLLTGAEANKITKEPFVVYLSGVDNRGELTENARSDVNILAVVNPVTKQAALINTPRDYYVDLAGTESKDKLTHAGLYGVETSMATLGNLYGVDVDHYIRINFAGFISIIDAIGGVDVYSDQAFTSVGSPGYYDPTTFAEGWNHLDGKSALAFARERHAFKTGDIQRGINQMKVIDAMANKLKSPALLMSFSKLMDAAADCFVTSFSQEQISALVRMQLGDLASWDIQSYTVTGSGAKSSKCYSAKGQSLYVMKPDENSVNEAKALIAAVLGGEDKLTSTSQTPEKTEVYTPTADPNAAASVPEESPDSVIVEEPAPSDVPAESEAADGQPAEGSTSGEPNASTEVPAEGSEEAPADSTESPSFSMPTQEQVEQAASSLHQAASTVLDALFGSGTGGGSSSASTPAA
ncbi:MAG: transcriptional regulator [Faecalibacterium prausnitzii]|nr:MAG: transcriptional regulator [Faecalibacterium prausnitzii]